MKQKLSRSFTMKMTERAYQSLVQFSDKLEVPIGQLIRQSVNHYLHYWQEKEKKERQGKGAK